MINNMSLNSNSFCLSCVILQKLVYIFGLNFFIFQVGIKYSVFLIQLLWVLNKLVHITHQEQCLQQTLDTILIL